MIEVETEDEAWSEALPGAAAICERAAGAALAEGGAEGDIAILLTGDEQVREINARFRDQDKPTNVLSFPAPETARPHLGDVALAFGVCAREAVDQGKPLDSHLAHLVAHGVLHLLGYDHMALHEAEEMEALERRILSGLGIPDPYGADRDDEDGADAR